MRTTPFKLLQLRPSRSPYERRPFRPDTRGERDVIPPWRLQTNCGVPLRSLHTSCAVAELYHEYPENWTPQYEILMMRRIEAGRANNIDYTSDDEFTFKSSQLTTGQEEIVSHDSFTHDPEIPNDDQRFPAGGVADNIDPSLGYRESRLSTNIDAVDKRGFSTSTRSSLVLMTPGIVSHRVPPSTSSTLLVTLPSWTWHSRVSSTGLESCKYRIRKQGIDVACFRSVGAEPLQHPMNLEQANPGDTYLHRSGLDQNQIWFRGYSGEWVSALPGVEHPQLTGYCLNISPEGWVRWVLKKTVSTYKGRQKVQKLEGVA